MSKACTVTLDHRCDNPRPPDWLLVRYSCRRAAWQVWDSFSAETLVEQISFCPFCGHDLQSTDINHKHELPADQIVN